MKNKIYFCSNGSVSEKYSPKPAIENLPEWYKKISSYIDNDKRPFLNGHQTRSTIKKCMPVFDSISMGYFIFLPYDIYIEYDGFQYNFVIPHESSQINNHPREQVEFHPYVTGDHVNVPKFSNPWSIKTQKGYSCLIIPPMHRENIIQILPGVVDTDRYDNYINLPFTVSKKEFTGIIPAGTPIAQVIPFKRESWKLNNISSKDIKESGTLVRSVFFEGYKKLFWSKKEYK